MVLSGVGSRGRCGFLSGIPHGIKSVSAVAVHVVQSDHTQNSLDPLSPLSQIASSSTQGRNRSMDESICLSDLPPRLCVESAQPLPEVTEKSDHDK